MAIFFIKNNNYIVIKKVNKKQAFNKNEVLCSNILKNKFSVSF